MGLEEHIIDHKHNKANLDELMSSFDKELFIPFIGAGPSTTLGEPEWSQLLADLCKACDVKYFKKAKREDGTTNYPESFSRLFKKVSDNNRFYSELFKLIKPTKTSATWFHRTLVETFNSYITTNYDSPIEKAFKDINSERLLKKQYFSCYGLKNIEDCIVYLHGHKDINFCIITSEDYNYFYPSVYGNPGGIPILEDFLTDVFTQRSIIFIGFSFDDRYIEKFLHYLNTKVAMRYSHYWLVSESTKSYKSVIQRYEAFKNRGNIIDADNELTKFYKGQLNIKPIVYKKGDHIFAEELLETLRKSNPDTITVGEISGKPRG